MLDKVFARLLMVSFFLPMNWQTAVILTAAAYFTVTSIRDVRHLTRSNFLWAMFLGSLYLLYVIAIPFTPPEFRSVTVTFCEYRLSFLLLPLLFAFLPKEKVATINNEILYFVYFAIAAAIGTNIIFIKQYALLPGGFHGITHVTYRVDFEKIIGLHPTYMSMYLAFAASILLVIGDRLRKPLKYVLFYLLLALLLPLLAKSPLIALGIIFVHMAWLRRRQLAQYKWVFGGMAVIFLLSYLFVPFISQRIHEMAGLSSNSIKGNVTDNSIYVRKMIWTVDTTLLRHYWLAGCGPGRLMHLLHTRYFFYALQYGYNIGQYDPHNAYFYEWISFGLAGILLLGAILMTHLLSAIKYKNYVYLYLLVILAVTFFTESVLARQQGVIFYSFFTSLFFFANKYRRQF